MEKEKLDKANNINLVINYCKNHIALYEKAREYRIVCLNDEEKTTANTIVLDLKNERIKEAYQLFLDTLLTIEDEKLVELNTQFKEL